MRARNDTLAQIFNLSVGQSEKSMKSKRVDTRIPVADYEKYQKLVMKFGVTLSDLVRNAMAYTYLGRTK